MLCDKCFKNIKLKFLFYFKSITSNAIYYMKEQMISISETRTDNIKNWSMIDDDDGYVSIMIPKQTVYVMKK